MKQRRLRGRRRPRHQRRRHGAGGWARSRGGSRAGTRGRARGRGPSGARGRGRGWGRTRGGACCLGLGRGQGGAVRRSGRRRVHMDGLRMWDRRLPRWPQRGRAVRLRCRPRLRLHHCMAVSRARQFCQEACHVAEGIVMSDIPAAPAEGRHRTETAQQQSVQT